MGVTDIILSKLTSSAARDIATLDVNSEQKRISRAKKLHAFYTFDRDAVLQYTRRAMGPTFNANTIAQMQFPLYNLTRKIIDRLAVAYMEPANRYVLVPKASVVEGTKETQVVDVRAKRDNEIYQRILETSNINAVAKSWNRLAKLFTTVYVGVFYNKDTRSIEYEVFPPHGLSVVPLRENYLEPGVIEYERMYGDKLYTVRWSETEHSITDSDDTAPADLNPWGGQNPYGVIPLIPCRLSVPEGHWGEGDTELVGLNEKLNILIASLFFNALMQSHGQPVAINIRTEEQVRKAKGEPMVTGPNVVIEATGVRKEDVAPDFRFASPDPAIESNIKAADWMIKTAAVMRGLSAQSVSIDPSGESGVSKTVDLAELSERRLDDIEWLRPFEKRLFDVTRAVWNKHEKDQLSDKAVFGIDFAEPRLPMTESERIAVKERKMALGLYSPVEDMVDEDEGIDEQQALAYILRNVGWNRQIQKAQDDGSQAV